MINGAPMEAKPSTEGAVGTEMKDVLVRWLAKRVMSVSVPEPTAM